MNMKCDACDVIQVVFSLTGENPSSPAPVGVAGAGAAAAVLRLSPELSPKPLLGHLGEAVHRRHEAKSLLPAFRGGDAAAAVLVADLPPGAGRCAPAHGATSHLVTTLSDSHTNTK